MFNIMCPGPARRREGLGTSLQPDSHVPPARQASNLVLWAHASYPPGAPATSATVRLRRVNFNSNRFRHRHPPPPRLSSQDELSAMPKSFPPMVSAAGGVSAMTPDLSW